MRRSVRLALVLTCAAALAGPIATAEASRAEVSGIAVHPWRFDPNGYVPMWPLRNAEVRARSFDALRAAGVRRARVDMRWNVVESHLKGVRDWAEFDAIHATAREYGIQLLPVVAFTPMWANDGGDVWVPPSNPQDFEDFFAAALERYPDIDAWEIWNEPNLGFFWRPAPDVGGFVQLLREADEARDRVGSQAKLISGGLSSTGQDPFGWFDEMARRGAFDHVDGFAIHPYGRGAPDARKSFFLQLPRFRERLVALGKPDTGIWITEYGSPNTTTATSYGPARSAEEQADSLRRAFALVAGWPWVRNLTWYELQEGCEDGADPECRFGLLDADFAPKPGWDALKQSIFGDLPRLRSETTLRATSVRQRAARRTRARRRAPAKRRLSVTGTVDTAGAEGGAAAVEITVTALSGRGAPRVVRSVTTSLRGGAFAKSLGSYGKGSWRVVARFAGTDRHAPSESRAATIRVR